MQTQQPLDLDPNFNTLLDNFPPGTRFTIQDATRVFGLQPNQCGQAEKYLRDLTAVLDDTDFLELRVQRGPLYRGGGHQFVALD